MANHRLRQEPTVLTRCGSCWVRPLALFQPLSSEETETAQQYRSEQRRIEPGGYVFSQGDLSRSVFTLLSGWAHLHETLLDGNRQILQFLLPGDLFGFQPEMGEGRRLYAVQAITAVDVCVFPYGSLMAMCQERPHVAMHLLSMIVRDEVEAFGHLACLGRRSARERIGHLLLELFDRACARLPNGDRIDTIDFPITQTLIADACGLTHIHVSRVMKCLNKEGLLQCGGGHLHIPDRKRLAELAGYRPTRKLRHTCP
jgi:CRP-like cAMP-binding protein